MILETQTPPNRSHSRLAAFLTFISLAIHGMAPAATFTWTNGVTGNWSSTSLTTDWKSATAPNAAGTAISYTHFPSGSASASVTLDMDATVGSIGHGAGPGGNTGSFTIQRDASSHVLTMDNTGGVTNLFGNSNAAIIGNGNANTYDITQLYPDIIISNTDLDIGSTSGGVKIGSSANSNSITATTSQNLNLRWNAGNAGRPMTVNASIGTSGAGTITLNHYGTGSPTHTMNLNGTIGSKVGGITQDTTVSILSLNGNNSAFAGSILLKSGILQANHANALGTGGNITFSGATLRYTAASEGQNWASRFKNSSSPISLDTNGRSVTLTAIDATNTAGLTKSGTGTLTLSAPNNFTGPTTVNAGTLRLGNGTTSAALSDSDAVIVFSGSTLNLNYSGTDTIRELWLNGTQMPPGIHGASDPSGLLTGAGTLTVTGTADVLPTTPGQKPGLREGMLAGAFNLTDPNPGHEVPLSTRMANTAVGWTENTTWLYTGEIHLDGGTYVFAEHFDDSVLLCIDGQVVLNDSQSSISTNSSLTLPAGWHSIELRLGNTGGAAGPVERRLAGLGVAWKKQGDADWNPLADTGDGEFPADHLLRRTARRLAACRLQHHRREPRRADQAGRGTRGHRQRMVRPHHLDLQRRDLSRERLLQLRRKLRRQRFLDHRRTVGSEQRPELGFHQQDALVRGRLAFLRTPAWQHLGRRGTIERRPRRPRRGLAKKRRTRLERSRKSRRRHPPAHPHHHRSLPVPIPGPARPRRSQPCQGTVGGKPTTRRTNHKARRHSLAVGNGQPLSRGRHVGLREARHINQSIP